MSCINIAEEPKKGAILAPLAPRLPAVFPGGAFLSSQEALFRTARSGQGRAVVRRGEADP
jgi:hypothetical protein